MSGRAIMIQGTASNAGKSLLAAGLCRIFARDGLRVAPFKSQNMALNSYLTADGLEMGRAQAVQARCAGIPPDVRMNPVLLKPTSDRGSQVIVMGKPAGHYSAQEYYAEKPRLVEPILAAYHSLAAEHDLIVMEGAGSPAEINLKEGDLVNMGLAKMVGAPVLLAGDTDRGGVFAALAGTHLLLTREERALLKGVIVNKFRGDRAILEPGLRMLEEIIQTPVVGVVPYLEVDLEDEDSLSGSFSGGGGGMLDIAVLRLPRIANFTDFAPLSAVEGVSLRYPASLRELGNPDLIILPGSKSPLPDLLWLRERGLEGAVQKFAAAAGPVLGIGGGFLMLGRSLQDPSRTVAGLGLLPFSASYGPESPRRQVRGRVGQVGGGLGGLAGADFSGYQLDGGAVQPLKDIPPFAILEDGAPEGMAKGNVYGTQIHGLLDREGAAAGLLGSLLARKGLPPDALAARDMAAYREGQLQILEDALRRSLDLDRIYAIIEEGIQ